MVATSRDLELTSERVVMTCPYTGVRLKEPVVALGCVGKHPNKTMGLEPANHFREQAIARGRKFLCPHCRRDITREPFVQHVHISAVLDLPDVAEVYFAGGIYARNSDGTSAIFRGCGSPFGQVRSIATSPPAKTASPPVKITTPPIGITSLATRAASLPPKTTMPAMKNMTQSFFAPSKKDINGVSTLSLQLPQKKLVHTKRKGGTWKPDNEADFKKIRSDENVLQKMISKKQKEEGKRENRTVSELARFWETTMDRFQDKFGHLVEEVE